MRATEEVAMPVEWPFAEDIIRLSGAGEHRIGAEDGNRQQETARSILDDLKTQPGVILADEVGMGKTYVALAVAASVVLATRDLGRPVVVMMPPGLARKWQREWQQFKTLCCARPDALSRVRDAYVHTPTEFFKRLDDPSARRPHIIWMTTGCFSRGLDDSWIKLALIRFARTRTKLSDSMKGRLFKWATSLVRMKSGGLRDDHVEWLLSHCPSEWHRYLKREGILEADSDDPIPADLMRHADRLDFGDRKDDTSGRNELGLVTLLRDRTIPGKTGAVSTATENDARWWVNRACQAAYWQWIERSSWRSPLLVMDEAHHAKNDETRLASLFRSEETKQLVEVGKTPTKRPLLWEKFDRMLFLTATPFQLGHHELIRVLRSFAAAKWTGATAPAGTREAFLAAMDELEKRLDEYRLAGRRLDRLWGKLAREAVARYTDKGDVAEAAAAWWRQVSAGGTEDPRDRELLRAVEECRRTKARAERDSEKPWFSLGPWVIRHNRPTHLPTKKADPAVPRKAGPAVPRKAGPAVPRRRHCPGRGIVEDDGRSTGEPLSVGAATGLPIEGEALLPFLLAARAQGELAQGSAEGRAFFAEGLCSSYEAFHHTRENRGDARDLDDDGLARSDKDGKAAPDRALVQVSWYVEQVRQLIPSKNARGEDRYRHPKIQAVVDRAVELWKAGEKVLIFCFYRETVKALHQHIAREVEKATFALAAEKLGLGSGRDEQQLAGWFRRVARRLADKDSPFHKEIIAKLREPLEDHQFDILSPHKKQIVQLLAAYVRSPSFIARYLPLEVSEVREALTEGARPQVVREGAEALARALMERTDASAMSMHRRVVEFLRFAKELAERSRQHIPADDGEADDPLTEYLKAIAVQTSGKEDEEATGTDQITFRVQQPVRMVDGDTKRETRERLMLAFNSPMFPEILISSAVLGEGVDLHRFCRYVIHHDLCWNPSTLEQRTGRLDRIRCKAEAALRPIVIYEPFLAGSADEKMFRVVRDRERWFQIVMGQKFSFDEATSEELANRVPLPEQLARDLVFDLTRFPTAASS
jgi:superfamily II DNA or RNA helicase